MLNHFIHQYSSTIIINIMFDDFNWRMFHLTTISSHRSSYFIQALILTYHKCHLIRLHPITSFHPSLDFNLSQMSSNQTSSYHFISSNFNFIQSIQFIKVLISCINTNSLSIGTHALKHLHIDHGWISFNYYFIH